MTDEPSQTQKSSQKSSPESSHPTDAATTDTPASAQAASDSADQSTAQDQSAAQHQSAAQDESSAPAAPPAAGAEQAGADQPPPPVAGKRQILIGSQRAGDTAAKTMKARPQAALLETASQTKSDTTASTNVPAPAQQAPHQKNDLAEEMDPESTLDLPELPAVAMPAPAGEFTPPPPRLTTQLSPDLQAEIDTALGDLSMDEIMAGSAPTVELEEGARVKAKVLSVHADNVLVDLNQQYQGVVSLKQFDSPPEPGATIDAIVSRLDSDEGLYELQVAGAAVDVAGWDELSEGMVVDAVITGHNKGGLECEVNKLRGFIPASQVGLYRVDNLEEMVGQRFACVVTEVKPEKRNLVLSRRSVLERERAESKQKLLQELKVGQVRDGVVRRLQPFGAFVDLGGVDGLIHISQLSWDRINHPSEVLQEGQTVKVKINKIDQDSGKIGLAYRDTWENPWEKAADKYKPKSAVQGCVTRLTDFGAFVKLEPGIEGLIHVSELAHHRVWRPSDVLSEGQEVDVMVLSVDPGAQRMSLSLKALQQPPAKKDNDSKKDAHPEPSDQPPPKKSKHKGKLRGGVDRPSGGEGFGLKW